MIELDQYTQPEGMDSDDYVVATYLLRSRYQDILKKNR